MKRYKKGKKKGPVRAKKVSIDGIDFRSGLEKHTYLALKKAKLFEKYEEEVFQTLQGFKFPNISFEKQSNGKGDMKNRGQKKISTFLSATMEPIATRGSRRKKAFTG